MKPLCAQHTDLAARRWKPRHGGTVDCPPKDRPNAAVGRGIGHDGRVQLQRRGEENTPNTLSSLPGTTEEGTEEKVQDGFPRLRALRRPVVSVQSRFLPRLNYNMA